MLKTTGYEEATDSALEVMERMTRERIRESHRELLMIRREKKRRQKRSEKK